mmetsp:Transcript_7896/g.33241  ORF Transcript_7896/g.33241 Transcript_7896/m.33241 type:complete len:797 (+) Transcript_7896:58-2448(+)
MPTISARDEDLLQLMDNLQAMSAKHTGVELDTPETYVFGQQSRGKSSICEALTRLPFNHCCNGIASRFPIKFRTIHDNNHPQPSWRIVDGGGSGRKGSGLTTKEISKIVEARNMELKNSSIVCSLPMVLEVRWCQAPNLSFTDLPGLRSLAMDRGEARLQQQIEEMVQNVIIENIHKASVTFIVVEDASEDVANFTGLSTVSKMIQNAKKHTDVEKSCDIVEHPSGRASGDITLLSPIHPSRDADSVMAPISDDCKFILVLNKLDIFTSSRTFTDDEKAEKVRRVTGQFHALRIPVFYTSLPTSSEKEVLEEKHAAALVGAAREDALLAAYAEALCAHSELDRKAMAGLLAGHGSHEQSMVGVDKLKSFIEKYIEEQALLALPRIQENLQDARAALLQGTGLANAEAQKFIAKQLPILSSKVSKQLELLLGGQATGQEDLSVLPSMTLEQEYEELSKKIGVDKSALQFSYRSSPLWKNKRYRARLEELVRANSMFSGGSQLRRVLWEFKLSVLCVQFPLIADDEFQLRVSNLRYSMNSMGGNLMDWTAVICKVLKTYCGNLLGDDTVVLATRMKAVVTSWLGPIIRNQLKQMDIDIESVPVSILKELEEANLAMVKKWCDKMQQSMISLCTSVIVDFQDQSLFRQKIATSTKTQASPNASPSASEVFDTVMAVMSTPTVSAVSQDGREARGCIEEDADDMRLLDADQPEDPVVLEKVRWICAVQLQFGCKRITETFWIMFNIMFLEPLSRKLGTKMVEWATAYPELLEDRLRSDSQLLQDVEHELARLTKLSEALR